MAALRLLDAVLRKGQTLDNAAASALRDVAAAEDRALTVAIAGEVLRRLPDLDALIDTATTTALPDDAKARMVLRIALVQLAVLKTPPHAVIATALPLLMGGPRRLVHGVLSTLIRKEGELPTRPALLPHVRTRWAYWGQDALGDAADALASPPPLDVTLRDPADHGGLDGDSLASGHIHLPRGTAIPALPGYDEGKWWVQNLAASVPARLLGEGNNQTVLDLCAAPGGKTMQLAARGWRVTAVDSHAGRIERLRANLARTRLTAEIVEADIMAWEPDESVDAILLDAPCTSTGTFARHPDVLHRIGQPDIVALAALQGRMLARAYEWLKPGGTMVFATCSLEREEGEDLVHGSTLPLDPIGPDALPPGIMPTAEGFVRILPKPGLDGFFIARFKR